MYLLCISMTMKNMSPRKYGTFFLTPPPGTSSRNLHPAPARNSSPRGIYSGKNCGQAVSVQVTVGRKREHKWGIPKPRERFCALFCPSNNIFSKHIFSYQLLPEGTPPAGAREPPSWSLSPSLPVKSHKFSEQELKVCC